MSDYFLLSPLGAEFALDAQPASRHEAFSLVAGLAGSAPGHGIWRLVLRFDDEEYGHVELDQLAFGHYPGQGWGISGSKLPVSVPVQREDVQLYGCHLRRLWDDAGSELRLTRAGDRYLCLYVPDPSPPPDGAKPGHKAVLMIRAAGMQYNMPYANTRADLGLCLQADVPTEFESLRMAEWIASAWSGAEGIRLLTPDDEDRSMHDTMDLIRLAEGLQR